MANPTEVQALRTKIERAGGGDAQQARTLKDMRSDLLALLADLDVRLEGAESKREAVAIDRKLDIAKARRRAALREELLAEGRFTADDLDAMGVFSDDQLDAMEADGSLEEALDATAVAA